MLLAWGWNGGGGAGGRGVSTTKFQARMWGAIWETCQERVRSVLDPQSPPA